MNRYAVLEILDNFVYRVAVYERSGGHKALADLMEGPFSSLMVVCKERGYTFEEIVALVPIQSINDNGVHPSLSLTVDISVANAHGVARIRNCAKALIAARTQLRRGV